MAQPRALLRTTARVGRNLANRGLSALYRYAVAKRILGTPPVTCGADQAYELHTLTFDSDLLATLWSLKSWYHFSGTRPALVIYAGGPLSSKSEAILSEHFPTCRIIQREIFNNKMKVFLNNYKASFKHSIMHSFYCALKLFGPMYFTQADSILYVDSDVLFFRKPRELLTHIKHQAACFNSDYQDAYALPPESIHKLLPVKLEQKVNAGLFHISRKDLAGGLDLAETYFANIPAVDPSSWAVNRHEQTLNAMLLSRAKAVRLSDAYQISKTPVSEQTVSHHFVNDGSRADFYRVGMRRLVSTGFLTSTSRAATTVQTHGYTS